MPSKVHKCDHDVVHACPEDTLRTCGQQVLVRPNLRLCRNLPACRASSVRVVLSSLSQMVHTEKHSREVIRVLLWLPGVLVDSRWPGSLVYKVPD